MEAGGGEWRAVAGGALSAPRLGQRVLHRTGSSEEGGRPAACLQHRMMVQRWWWEQEGGGVPKAVLCWCGGRMSTKARSAQGGKEAGGMSDPCSWISGGRSVAKEPCRVCTLRWGMLGGRTGATPPRPTATALGAQHRMRITGQRAWLHPSLHWRLHGPTTGRTTCSAPDLGMLHR